MNKLLKDRVRLIRSLMKSLDVAELSSEYRDEMGDVISRIRQDDLQHFLSFSQEEPNKVSYAAKPEYKFDNNRRTKTTVTRYLQRNYAIKWPAHVLQNFTFHTGAFLTEDFEYQILRGSDIVEAYERGVGGSSCMTGSGAKYTQLYADNPAKVGLLVYNRSRALIWKCDCGHTIIDRIYPNEGQNNAVIRNWAKTQGFLYRTHDHMPSEDYVQISDRGIHHVTLRDTGDNYPYLDTFHWGDFIGKNLVLYTEAGHACVFDSTEGNYNDDTSGIDYFSCRRCGDREPEEDAYGVGDYLYCGYCYREHTNPCDHCDEVYDNDELYDVDGETWCSSCRRRYSILCDQCGSSTTNIGNIDQNQTYCEECMNTIEYCTQCGKGIPKDQETCIDEEFYCRTCAQKNNNSL